MSLNSALMPVLNRALLNLGTTYRVVLERGLTVAFQFRSSGMLIMQLSRPLPSKPSQLEIDTCLRAINIQPKVNLQQVELQDEKHAYVQVKFAPPRM